MSITVKQLRESLALLGEGHDDREVLVWLPGSRIELGRTFLPGRDDGVLIEGNVRAGSALDAVVDPSKELCELLAALQAQLLPDALCKEKGGLIAASRERCSALVRRIIATMPERIPER